MRCVEFAFNGCWQFYLFGPIMSYITVSYSGFIAKTVCGDIYIDFINLSSRKLHWKIDISSLSTILPIFWEIQSGSTESRGTLISSIGTGLWETYSFIYSSGQFKVELTVRRIFVRYQGRPPLFDIWQYDGDAFCQPVIGETVQMSSTFFSLLGKMFFIETDFLLDRVCFLYDWNFQGIRLRT